MYRIVGTDLKTVEYIEVETGNIFCRFISPKIYEYKNERHYILNNFIFKEDVTVLFEILKCIEEEKVFETLKSLEEFVDSI